MSPQSRDLDIGDIRAGRSTPFPLPVQIVSDPSQYQLWYSPGHLVVLLIYQKVRAQ